MKQTVNARQFAIVTFIVAVSTKIFMLPALIMGISGRDSWLTLLFYFLIEFIVLVSIIITIKKRPELSVYQVLEMSLGKIISKIVLSVIIIYYLLKTTVMISEIKVFFVITATESLNWQLCIIPFLVAIGLMSVKTLRGIGRLSEIILPMLCICYIALGLIMAKNTNFTNILPMFENGISSNFRSFFALPIWLTDFSILTIFLGRVEQKKQIMRGSLIACALAFVGVLYFNIVMLTTYSYAPKLLDYGHNVTNMLIYPTATYNYGRFDLVIFSIWMLGIMIHLALMFYALSRHFKRVSGVKSNYINALVLIAALFILVEHIFPDELRLYSYSVTVFNYLAFIVEILFPIAVMLLALKKRRHYETR